VSRARLRGRREDREFLPALLEIQDSPPSPLGMALGLIILALVAAVAAWAILGSLDVVAVARGRVIAAGHSKLIQPLEAGLIRAIRVADGAAVRRGQVLVELDPTVSGADETRLASEEAAARVHIARLRALLAGQPSFDGPPGAEAGLVALQRQLLADQRQEQERRLEAAALGISQRVSAVEGARANVERLQMLVAMQTERAQAYRTLFEREYVARMQYLEVEERRVDRVQELAMERQPRRRPWLEPDRDRDRRRALGVDHALEEVLLGLDHMRHGPGRLEGLRAQRIRPDPHAVGAGLADLQEREVVGRHDRQVLGDPGADLRHRDGDAGGECEDRHDEDEPDLAPVDVPEPADDGSHSRELFQPAQAPPTGRPP